MATVGGLNPNIGGIRPEGTPPAATPGKNATDRGVFRAQLEALRSNPPAGPNEVLDGAGATRLKFSNHAIDRMRSRGLSFSPEEMGRIQNGVAKAAAKGSKETLLITDQAAMIVSIKDKTVVTVMDKASLKENVFTNIDSTVMV